VQANERNRSSHGRRSGRTSLHWENKFIDKTHNTVQRLQYGRLNSGNAHDCSPIIPSLGVTRSTTTPCRL
jgi:hypothetical protein